MTKVYKICPNGHVNSRKVRPEPPDPDRYGNRRVTWRCSECSEKGTWVFGGKAGKLSPKDWESVSPKWFQVKFPDAGTGDAWMEAYIQAVTEDHAREIAKEHGKFVMFDTKQGTVSKVGEHLTHIAEGLNQDGPSLAITLEGDNIRSGDISLAGCKTENSVTASGD